MAQRMYSFSAAETIRIEAVYNGDPDRLVPARRGKRLAVRAESHGVHQAGVSREGASQLGFLGRQR
jgi:hypothetical protein